MYVRTSVRRIQQSVGVPLRTEREVCFVRHRSRQQAAQRFGVAFLAVSVVVQAPALGAQQDRGQVLEAFAERIRADVEADGIASITVGVQVGDSLVFARSFGFADKARDIPARPEMLYRVGSISKSFTATLMVDLVEDGFFRLDEEVRQYLPSVEAIQGLVDDARPITFRQLASHTAGLEREPGMQGAASGPIDLWEQRTLASIPTTSFQDRPGARYSYSNIGFGILGLAVSRAAEAPFMDLVQDRIFGPLGMDRTTFVVEGALLADLTAGHANRSDGTVNVDGPAREHEGRGYKVPNGGVYSTVGDLGRFMASMWGGGRTMLTRPGRTEMMGVQTPEDLRTGYGLGFTIREEVRGTKEVGHGGSVAGYTAHMLFDPDAEIGVVLLRNYGSGATNLGAASLDLLTALRAGEQG
jgi:CubicO group peptidase (beta-lactamase class C family)